MLIFQTDFFAKILRLQRCKSMQILQNLKKLKFAEFQKFQLDNLVDFEKCCKTRIFLQRSVPIQPKTSENLPTFCQKLARPQLLRRDGGRGEPALRHLVTPASIHGEEIGRFCKVLQKFANFCKFLAGSFSAVSKRNFARKYAFDSIFQALQDLHPFAPLQSQNFRKKSV